MSDVETSTPLPPATLPHDETNAPNTDNIPPNVESTDPRNHAAIYQQLSYWIDHARSALEDIKKVLVDYDARNQATEKASEHLGGAMARVNSALGDLSQAVTSFKDGASEVPVKALSTTIARVSGAFAHLLETAHKYDEQFQLSTKVASVISGPKDRAITAITYVAGHSAAAAAAANAQLQGVSDGLRARLTNVALSGIDLALPAAVKVDDRLHVAEKANAVGNVIAQRAKDLDDRFGLSGYVEAAVERAENLDQRVTGGRVTPAILSAYQAGLRAVGYVQGRYEDLKQKNEKGEIEADVSK